MLLSGKDAAKELRAFGLGDFRERFDRLYDEHLVELRKVARQRLRVSLLGNLATTVGLAGIVAALLVLALNGRIGLADAGTAAGAVFVLGERLMNAVFSAGMLYESSLFIEDFTSFLAMAPEVEAAGGATRPRPASGGCGWRTSASPTRAPPPRGDGVSMEIGAGEIVALVGENGSGKTTLAKLLCRLYPTAAALWDGVDTATVDPDGLRRSVAVIFQDFLHYALPAAENIGMGRHQRIGDAEAIRGRRCTPAPTTSWPSCPGLRDRARARVRGGQGALGRPVAASRPGQGVLPRRPVHHPRRADRGPRRQGRARAVREHPDPVPGRSVLLISHRFSSVRLPTASTSLTAAGWSSRAATTS